MASHVQTYHCVCTNLVLATTYDLSTLPRRAAPGLDTAYILPVPPPATTAAHTHVTPLQDEQHDQVMRPTMVQRDDGFEKRYLVRCGRCALVFGYQLDWTQYTTDEAGPGTGRRRDVLYVLPGSVVATETMMEG